MIYISLTIVSIVLIIVSVLLIIYSYCNLRLSEHLKINKHEQEQNNLKNLNNQIQTKQQELNNIINNIENKQTFLSDLTIKITQQEKDMQALLQEQFNNCSMSYAQQIENAYLNFENQYDCKTKQIKEEYQKTEEEYLKLKNSLIAANQAILREKEKDDNLSFYKLSLTENDLQDIKVLIQMKSMLHQPVILSKLIWSTYFQKQTTELCNRVIGTEKKCGIYKITNLNTKQAYVGQSVDISQRWKDHIKCGLGIDAPATNKLYNIMQQEGIWNFSFELLEECPREQLNEKERFFINLYQTDKFGFNSTKGNK